jgi:hypothetical protein
MAHVFDVVTRNAPNDRRPRRRAAGTSHALVEIMHSKKKRPRSPFVVTLSAAAMLGACGGATVSGNPAPPEFDGGVADGGNPLGCPTTAPTANACALQDGSTCSYGAGCYPSQYVCEQGQWQRRISNPPAPMCPTTEPAPGAACDACQYPSTLRCTYVTGTCQGQPIQGEIDCVAGKWQQMTGIGSCNPPAPDASPPPPMDAGVPVDAGGPTEAGGD